jgi:hypothetical protein
MPHPEPVSGHPATAQSEAVVVLRAVLSQNPDALVAAIDPGPLGRFVTVPADLPIAGL